MSGGGYVLGHFDAELQRLETQARIKQSGARVEHGIAQPAELDADTLLDRMHREVLANGSVVTGHLEIGAWAPARHPA